jgi:hypothetical protein
MVQMVGTPFFKAMVDALDLDDETKRGMLANKNLDSLKVRLLRWHGVNI